MLKHIFALAAFGLASLSSSIAFAEDVKIGNLTIAAPYVRAMVPGAPVGGGYVTITNTGDTDDRLIAASSPRAETVQIHEMRMDKDIMVMRELAMACPYPPARPSSSSPAAIM